MFKKLKETINQLLATIANQNQALYGKERMDCCKLNKDRKR